VTARAIWQGTLVVQKRRIAVKLYSAVLDRQIHFHLLHKPDRTRIQQRMVDSQTEETIPLDQARKAFQAEPGVYVVVTPEELEQTAPEANRDIKTSRFVPIRAIDPQRFDRPYYLGPSEGSEADYFALVQALESKKSAGIASWVMRKHAYVGALIAQDRYLMLVTLRHAGEFIPLEELEPPQGRALDAKELAMAGKLIEALTGEFQPDVYKDEYQYRVRELIEAKQKGKKLKPKRARVRRQESSLADSLRASLKQVQANQRA
jgi:DNA end-binding protein Ku